MKDDLLYMIHMVEYGRKVREHVSAVTCDQFDSDEMLRFALTHLIQVIGEAATRVSAGGRAALPEVSWHRITAMRHRIVHD